MYHRTSFDPRQGRPINVGIIANALNRHLFDANGGRQNFDVFIHCWSYDLAKTLNRLYHPVLAEYENQELLNKTILSQIPGGDKSKHGGGYSAFAGVASFLSMQKAMSLVSKHEDDCNFTYSKIILYRPDVLVWRNDIKLANYNASRVTANAHDLKGTGDFIG